MPDTPHPTPTQRLRVLPETFTVTLHAADAAPAVMADRGWWAMIRAPEGLTVVREARGGTAAQCWRGVYAQAGHGLDVPGMLAALVTPLAAAGIPVFVSSTFDADLVLVPVERETDAVEALRAAGHDVAGPVT